MQYQDYYDSLGVQKSASQDEIRDAFRKLARQYHPDTNQGDQAAEDKFKAINEAYQVLSDADKRKKYDQFGSQWNQYTGSGGRPEDFDWGRWSGGPGGAYGRNINVEDLGDLFGGAGGVGGAGGFSDFFQTLFGRQGAGAQSRPRRGRDLNQEIQINLNEAFSGATRIFEKDDGSRIEVKIPAGVKTGSKVRVAGQGGKTLYGGQPGDLFLRIRVANHPRLKRRGIDLQVSVPVDLYTAILGGKISVAGIDRTVTMTVPALTDNGKTIRLRGLGMPDLRKKGERGDLLAKIAIQLPTELSEEEQALFEQLRALKTNETQEA
jgi:curved DNA-binding protein